MSDPVGELYQSRGYPPMSHPSTDPAVTSVAALFGGLRPPHPSTARILEIGCASGHNLLPLGVRWPGASFTGVDISHEAVASASRRAREAGIANVSFEAADLRGFAKPGQEFDYIIAHGVFSWVADDAKKALLDFCAAHLSPTGIATISFNLWTGWEKRMPVIDAVRRIQREHGVDLIKALAILREVVEDPGVRATVDDMLAKGPEILAFDDYAPVNDPWPLDRFAAAAVACGLRWLGDSDPAENIPSSLDDAARTTLAPLAGDPLRMQMTADAMADRTFRSALLCRADAPLAERMTTRLVLDLSVRSGEEPAPVPADGFMQVLASFEPDAVPVEEVVARMHEPDVPATVRTVFQAITRGQLRARIEPVRITGAAGSHPRLDAFRLLCARERIPLVDAWHSPCVFSDRTYSLLGEMDGTKSVEDLAAISEKQCPDLAFHVWLGHLAGRGLFG